MLGWSNDVNTNRLPSGLQNGSDAYASGHDGRIAPMRVAVPVVPVMVTAVR